MGYNGNQYYINNNNDMVSSFAIGRGRARGWSNSRGGHAQASNGGGSGSGFSGPTAATMRGVVENWI